MTPARTTEIAETLTAWIEIAQDTVWTPLMTSAGAEQVVFLAFVGFLLYLARSARRAGAAPEALYRDQPGRQLQGVCAGLAAWSGVPRGVVQLAWVALLFVQPGPVLLLYLLTSAMIPWRPVTASA